MSYENVYPKIVCVDREQNDFREKRTAKKICLLSSSAIMLFSLTPRGGFMHPKPARYTSLPG
jgi:hypothetical protein